MPRPSHSQRRSSSIRRGALAGLVLAILTAPSPSLIAAGDVGRGPSAAPEAPHLAPAAYVTNSSTWQEWRNFSVPIGSPAPPGRSGAAIAYDPALHGVVVFGGEQVFRIPVAPGLARYLLGDTWLFADGRWQNLTPSHSPSPRVASTMGWDPVDGYLVLFGGFDFSGYFNETWALENETWVQLGSTLSPPESQTQGAMTWDAADHYLLLYGGESTTEAGLPSSWMFNSTWTFVGGNWTNRTTNVTGAPRGLGSPQLTYDPTAHAVVLFGGRYYTPETSPLGRYWNLVDSNSTWEYSAGRWTNESTVVTPAGADSGGMAYDAALNGDVLFGGELSAGTIPGNDHTWLFRGDNWTDITANLTNLAPTSVAPGLVDDAGGGFLLLFGGFNQTDYDLNATWVLGPPVLGGLTVTPPTVDLDQTVTLNATAVAAEGTLSYRFQGSLPGCALGSSPVVTCQPDQAGTYAVGVEVNDSDGYRANDSATITVGTPPTVQSFAIDPSTITLGRTIEVTATVLGGAPPVRLAFTGFPPGCPSSGTGNFTCQPTSAGAYDARMVATDAAGEAASASAILLVRAPTGIAAFTAGPSPLDVGQLLQLSVTAVNGTPPYSYEYSGLPSNCTSVDAPTLLCHPGQPGAFVIHLEVSDAQGVAANVSATVDVNPDPAIATWEASPSDFDLGNATTLRADGVGGTGGLRWGYEDLPPGCVSRNVSNLVCRPVSSGDFNVSVTATDTLGVSASASLPIEIAAPLVVKGLEVSPGAIDADQPFEVGATVTGGTLPLTYAYAGLPPACVVTSLESVTCQPPSGQYVISLTVRDAVGVAQSVRSLVVVYRTAAVQLNATGGGNAVVGATVTFGAGPAGGAPPYKFRFSGLPDGCTNTSGASVTCVLGAPGTYAVAVEMTDAAGERASAQLVVHVTTAVAPSSAAVVLGGIAGLAAAGILVLVLTRRRRRSGAGEARPEPAGERRLQNARWGPS